MLASKNELLASKYYELLKSSRNSAKIYLIYKLKLPALLYKTTIKLNAFLG
jgi:hypothetical protein